MKPVLVTDGKAVAVVDAETGEPVRGVVDIKFTYGLDKASLLVVSIRQDCEYGLPAVEAEDEPDDEPARAGPPATL